ncbi:MAG: hemolysin III family protein [Planctomycetia bacterium]|nr:hemolysin III family protein [Planctomycetia bacterium]
MKKEPSVSCDEGILPDKPYSLGEEIANSITHGIGVLLSISALVLLIIRAVYRAPDGLTAPYVVGFAIFGSSLIILYLMSTLYHAITHRGAKFVFCILDHSAIYILIAGTYTAFCFSVLYGAVGWYIFGIIWFLAVAGILLFTFYGNRAKWLSLGLYLLMGWLITVIGNLMYLSLPPISWNFLVYGGIAYTLGCIFFLMKDVPWMHAVWHLFVLSGSCLHFFSLYFAV